MRRTIDRSHHLQSHEGALSYDPDGTGSAAPVQFATLSPGPQGDRERFRDLVNRLVGSIQ